MKHSRLLIALILCLALSLCLAPAASAEDGVKPPVITRQPNDVMVSENANAKFTVMATGENLKYQWQVETGKDVWTDCTEAGADSASLSFVGTADCDGMKLRCVVSNEGGSVESKTVKLKVTLRAPSIKKQPTAPSAREDETVELSLEAAGSKLSYQWQVLDGNVWKDCTEKGADSPTLSLTGSAENKGRRYRCTVSNSAGKVNSSTVTFSVKLRDDEALEKVQELTKAKSYEEAINYAEDYYRSVPMAERREDLLKACVHAYVQWAEQLQYAKPAQVEKAEMLLKSCCETYKGTNAVTEAEKAAAKLENMLKQNEPASGRRFKQSDMGGASVLIIKNYGPATLVKLEDVNDPSRCTTVYVRSDSTARINVRDGSYTLKFASGERWYSEDELFGSGTSYSKANTTLEYETTVSGNAWQAWQTTLTLNTVSGNLSSTGIKADDF